VWNSTLEQSQRLSSSRLSPRTCTGPTLPERTSGASLVCRYLWLYTADRALACDLGPQRGAEELTRQLNLVYDALIAQVDCYGGSVVGFSAMPHVLV